MAYGILHGIITLILMLIFSGIVWWAYSKKQKRRFDEAANLPFADEPVELETKAETKEREL